MDYPNTKTNKSRGYIIPLILAIVLVGGIFYVQSRKGEREETQTSQRREAKEEAGASSEQVNPDGDRAAPQEGKAKVEVREQQAESNPKPKAVTRLQVERREVSVLALYGKTLKRSFSFSGRSSRTEVLNFFFVQMLCLSALFFALPYLLLSLSGYTEKTQYTIRGFLLSPKSS